MNLKKYCHQPNVEIKTHPTQPLQPTQQIDEVKWDLHSQWKNTFRERLENLCEMYVPDGVPILTMKAANHVEEYIIAPLQTSNQQLREQLKEKEAIIENEKAKLEITLQAGEWADDEAEKKINDLISTIQRINENIVTSNYKEANRIAIAVLDKIKK